MLKIKLFPRGKKHQRTFRIVVAENRTKYNGNYVADLGFYTPQTKTLDYNKEELARWIKNGAQVTLGVDKLINPSAHPRPVKVKVPKPVKAEPVAAEPVVETQPANAEAAEAEQVNTEPTETPVVEETAN